MRWSFNTDVVTPRFLGVEAGLFPADPELAAIRQGYRLAALELLNDAGLQRRCLPDVAAKLIELLNGSRADAPAVERLLGPDPFVSGQLLSMANSALFSPGQPIVGVRDAIVRIGFDAVRDMVMLVLTTSTMFRIPGFEPQARMLRLRALTVATACRSIAGIIRRQGDFAFLAGLLHDIGHLLMFERAQKKGLLSAKILATPAFMTAALEECAVCHEAVGATLCEAWKLPEGVVHAAGDHHRFDRTEHECLPGVLAAVGDMFADHFGVGVAAQSIDARSPVLRKVGLAPPDVQTILAEMRAQLPWLNGGEPRTA